MGKQIFTIKGMIKDISPSKVSNEYALDVQNMRLSTTDDGQYISLTSEKGNRIVELVYHSDATGYAIASTDIIIKYCTLDKYLILFVYRSDSVSMIYRLHFIEDNPSTGNSRMSVLRLYSGNLELTPDMEIDTKQIYENEITQKVYWVDGVHQPRVINIIADDTTISNWQAASYIPFDYFPVLKLQENFTIEKIPVYGLFNAGVIQYVFSYYNKKSAESQAVYTSPIYYVNPGERGGSPEETVNKSFRIKVYNPDTNFQFCKIYSIFRSSLNGTIVCKKVTDLDVTATQTGTISVDDAYNEFTPSPYSGTITMNNPYVEIFPLNGVLDMESNIHYPWHNSERLPLSNFLTSVSGTTRTYTITQSIDNTFVGQFGIRGTGVILHTGMIINGEELVLRYFCSFSSLELSATMTIRETLHDDGTFSYTFKQDATTLVGTPGTISSKETHTTTTDNPHLEYIDNGMEGEVVDASHILWLGTGRDIIPKTLEEKSNTLFFGNYKIKSDTLSEADMETIKNGCTISFNYGNEIDKGSLDSLYMYYNQLSYNQEEISGFKGGEYYSFGIVLQNNKGVWSPVIPLSTVQNFLYPLDNITSFNPVKAKLTFNSAARTILNNFKKLKVVVRQDFGSIIGQGVVSPTVFNKSRFTGDLYAMSSWFFRDVLSDEPEDYRPQSRHHYNISNAEYHPAVGQDPGVYNFHFYGEIFGASYDEIVYEELDKEAQFNDCDFFVDWNTLTFHSPDMVYGDYHGLENIDMRIVGIVPITAGQTDMTITLNTATELESEDYVQYWDENFNYEKQEYTNLDGNAVHIDLNRYAYQGVNRYSHYPIYTWHRLGSLSNQEQPNGSDNWYGELNTKYMQSLRQSAYSIFLSNSLPSTYEYHIKNIGFFREGDSTIKLGTKLYQGNVNMLPQAFNYKMSYVSSGESRYKHYYPSTQQYGVALSNEGVPIKYKSSPHIVAELDEGIILPNVSYPSLWYRFPSYFQPFKPLYISGVAPQSEMFFTTLDDGSIPLYTISDTDVNLRTKSFLTIKASITESELADNFTPTLYGDYYSYVLNSGSSSWAATKPTLDQFDLVVVVPDQEPQDAEDYPIEVKILGSYTGGGGWGALGTLSVYPTETQQMTGYKQPGTYTWINKYYPDPFSGMANTLFKMERQEAYNYNELYLVYNDPVQNIKKYFTVYYGTGFDPYLANTFWNEKDSNGKVLYTKGFMLHTTKQYEFNQRSPILPSFQTPYLYLVDFFHKYSNTPNLTDEQPIWKTASLSSNISNVVKATIGDTYYQRFDCMKTFPYSESDINQVAEIFSFMCESKVNIDGRYDTWRGVLDTSLNGETYKLNAVYSQPDNLYTYHYLSEDYIDDFPNQITWTLTKVFGEDIDSWTHLTLLSTLDMSGSFGQITKLINWNDNLICLQESSFAKILYNERAALTTTSGVPVELGNSGKVEGYTYVSQFAGTSSIKTVEITKTGIYFVDHHTKEVYMFNGNLQSVSKLKGMNTYFHNEEIANMHIDYDADLQCVYFITPTKCICFDEQVMQFTSFFSYENSGLVNLKDKFIAIKNVHDGLIWEQFEGDYNKFFTEWKPFGLTVIANENPTTDKTFTNIEFRADSYDHSGNLLDFKTFDSIKADNEYQSASDILLNNKNLRKKFRIWRADMPRVGVLGRVRNTWSSIGLYMSDREDEQEHLINENIGKTVLHDLVVSYV